jgi:hypothetical protein
MAQVYRVRKVGRESLVRLAHKAVRAGRVMSAKMVCKDRKAMLAQMVYRATKAGREVRATKDFKAMLAKMVYKGFKEMMAQMVCRAIRAGKGLLLLVLQAHKVILVRRVHKAWLESVIRVLKGFKDCPEVVKAFKAQLAHRAVKEMSAKLEFRASRVIRAGRVLLVRLVLRGYRDHKAHRVQMDRTARTVCRGHKEMLVRMVCKAHKEMLVRMVCKAHREIRVILGLGYKGLRAMLALTDCKDFKATEVFKVLQVRPKGMNHSC